MGMDLKEIYINTLGMKMLKIKAGSFLMGSSNGDFDEMPCHKVNISSSFHIAACEITNRQYEQFDPDHVKLRGKFGYSDKDDDAVVFVSWREANEFCKWLSEKEGLQYRLPTEAEWEFAARAGTTTEFFTGDTLPEEYYRNQKETELFPKGESKNSISVSLSTGKTPPNAWGLYDVCGNVEEWCCDWYGRYSEDEQTDPSGPDSGYCRVTRGGSHSTDVRYLRSASRMGAIADDRHWFIGFRIMIGEKILHEESPVIKSLRNIQIADSISQNPMAGSNVIPELQFFTGPVEYIHQPDRYSILPMYPHNHCPSITWCDNGDLLAVWFSTITERGREMVVLSSRLSPGSIEWSIPSLFFHVPDRNLTGTALLNDHKGRIYHFNGVSTGYAFRNNLALVMRISEDCGQTWSLPCFINTERGIPSQPVSGAFMTYDNTIVFASDAPFMLKGGASVIWMSSDKGRTWNLSRNPIKGIHPGIIQKQDGSLLAYGRSIPLSEAEKDVGNCIPSSISPDMGSTWEHLDTRHPPIGGGQRLVLLRLREGPILLVSFTDLLKKHSPYPKGMQFTDALGRIIKGYGMYCALSFDEGLTWPVKKLITCDEEKEYDGKGWTGRFMADSRHTEPGGYLAATQTPDHRIHLISSGLYYSFNTAWILAGKD